MSSESVPSYFNDFKTWFSSSRLYSALSSVLEDLNLELITDFTLVNDLFKEGGAVDVVVGDTSSIV